MASTVLAAFSTTLCRKDAMVVTAALASLFMASEAEKTWAPSSGTVLANCYATVWSALSTNTLPVVRPGSGAAHTKPWSDG